MVGIGTLVSAAVSFLSNVTNNVISKLIIINEAIKRGRTEAINEAYEENAKRSKRAMRVLMQPIKTGSDLINSIRDRRNRMLNKK